MRPDTPQACQGCKVMHKWDCKMQLICTRYRAYQRRRTECELVAQTVEGIARYRKRVGRQSFKGGQM